MNTIEHEIIFNVNSIIGNASETVMKQWHTRTAEI